MGLGPCAFVHHRPHSPDPVFPRNRTAGDYAAAQHKPNFNRGIARSFGRLWTANRERRRRIEHDQYNVPWASSEEDGG